MTAADAPAPGLDDEERIAVELRYIARVRSMLPSRRALAALDADEANLRAELARLRGSATQLADGSPGRP